jgi:hypothetical protein
VAQQQDLWQLAQSHQADQVFSTIVTAQSVERDLSTEEGLQSALDWCRKTGVTKVYIESFRDGLWAKRGNLVRARDRFRDAGIAVSGCVTTTRMAKSSEAGWAAFPCFTNAATQQQLQDIFEFTAPLFDEIMIDDFYCTGCECAECRAARGDRSWAEYRLGLMRRVSRERVLEPVRRVNPRAKVIIKYPQWYEEFPERGYDPGGETALFDRTWVGTETRDINDQRWGGCATYRAFWIMRWLGQIGGEKCGGGWYDPYGTHEDSYLEQARQTILGGARESVLFCYPSLQEDTGPANVEALRRELPRLFDLAAWVKGETPRGVVSYKPIGSTAEGERYVFDWLGMVGLPVVPVHEFPAHASVALFAADAAHDPRFAQRAADFISRGGAAIFTQPAAAAAKVQESPKAFVFSPPGNLRLLLDLPADRIAALRRAALAPLGLELEGPTEVALYLLGDRKLALESFRNESAEMRLAMPHAGQYRVVLSLGHEGAAASVRDGRLAVTIPPRTLVCLERAR